MNDKVKLILVALGIVLSPTIIILASEIINLSVDFTIYLILSLFLLIPFSFVIFLVRNQNMELKKINNNKKIGIIINPFLNIKTLVSLAKPEEEIKNVKKSYELISADYWIHPLLFINILPNLFFQIKIIETSEAYYLDKRIPNILGPFIFLILAILTILFFQAYSSLLFLFLVAIVFILIIRMIYVIVFPLNQIQEIKKDWISERNQNGKWFSIRGVYPRNVIRTLNPDPFFSSWGNITNSFFYKFRN